MYDREDRVRKTGSRCHRPEPPGTVDAPRGSATTAGGSESFTRRAQRSTHPTISIVIPARNEAKNLEVVLPELPGVDQIVLVDGHSVDGTMAVARRLKQDIALVQQTRIGKGNALVCGFAAAKGDIIVMFDADGSADPSEIPAFIEALLAGADFAKGTRFRHDGGSADITLLRRVGNAFLNAATNVLFGTRFSDLCYGYNAFWRDILPLLNLPPVHNLAARRNMLWGDGFEIETLLHCRVAAAGLSISEVPSVERARIFGRTHLRTFADGARVLRTITIEWCHSVYGRKAAREIPPVVRAGLFEKTAARDLPRECPRDLAAGESR